MMNTRPSRTDPLDLAPLPAGAWLDPALQMNVPLDPASDALLGPARRAGVMMFVLGGLVLLFAMVCFAGGYTAPQQMADPSLAEVTKPFRQFEEQTHIKIGVALIMFSVALAALALAYLILAPFVLRGAQAAIILSGLLSGAVVVFLLAVAAVAAQGQGAGPTVLFSLPFGLLLMWLWQALGNTTRLRQTRADWERRRWATLEQQQAYAPGFTAYYEAPKPSSPVRGSGN